MDILKSLSKLSHVLPTLGDVMAVIERLTELTPHHRRLLFSIIEKVLVKILEDGRTHPEYCSSVERLQQFLLHLPSNNRTDVWFGGPTRCKTGSTERETYVAALIISCGLIEQRDNRCLVPVLDQVSKEYRSSAEFAHFISSQDDRLLGVLLSLFILKDSIGAHDILNHRSVCLHVFAEIAFNYEVILDWLNSELLSLPLLLRFLDDLTLNLTSWQEMAAVVRGLRENAEEMSFKAGTWIENQPDDDGEQLVLQLKELAGTSVVHNEIRLSKREPIRVYVPPSVHVSEEPYFSLLYDMLVRLRLRLEAISSKELGNYGAVVRLVEKFEELVDGTDEGEDSEMSTH